MAGLRLLLAFLVSGSLMLAVGQAEAGAPGKSADCAAICTVRLSEIDGLDAYARSARRNFLAVDRLAVVSLRQNIDAERRATWRWQQIAMSSMTKSEFLERKTAGIHSLKWQYRLWKERRQSAQKYAQDILQSNGYLPPAKARILGHWLATKLYGWAGKQWDCLDELWGTKHGQILESGWYVKADNPASDAYGIPQALPGSKMGPGWLGSARVQIMWGLRYIRGSANFQNPCEALSFRLKSHYY